MRESQSNGEVENANQATQRKTRTVRLGVETRYKIELMRNSLIVQWMIRYAAEMITEMVVGKMDEQYGKE